MATKKKVVKKKSRVSPDIPIQKNFVKYEDLVDGEAFLFRGKLWIKMDINDQEGICLGEDAEWDCCLCSEIVEPVDITITWERNL